MEIKFRITTQGISQDFATANGDYGSIDRGEADQFELYEIFKKVIDLKYPDISEETDFCYPNIIINKGKNEIVTFHGEKGKLIFSDQDRLVTVKQAVAFVFELQGASKSAADPKKSDTDQQRRGKAAKINKNEINTGAGCPQVSLRVWKSSGWKEFTYAFPISFGLMLFFMGILVAGSGNKEDMEAVPLFFVIGSFVFLSFIPLKLMAKTTIRLGIDKATNTCWVLRDNKGLIGYEENADRITSFSYANNTSVSSDPRFYSGHSITPLRIKKSWILKIKRTTSDFEFGFSGGIVATRKEADALSRKANSLIAGIR